MDLGALYAFTEFLGVHYLLSAAIAFAIGLSTNYALSVRWVFDKRAFESRWAELIIFAVICVVGLGLLELCMWGMTEYLSIHYLGAKLASTVVVYMWNFLARKIVLFR